jgi:hypothetical protein
MRPEESEAMKIMTTAEPTPLVIAVRYPRLYEALRTLLKETLDLLRKEPVPPWPTRPILKIVFDSANSSHSESATEEFPGDVLNGLQSQLESLPSYRTAVDEIDSLLHSAERMPSFAPTSQGFVLPVLSRYLDIHRSVQFDETAFQGAYGYVEDYLATDALSVRLYFSLFGLGEHEDEIKLSDSHRIYKVNQAEARRVGRLTSLPGPRWPYSWPIAWPAPGTHLLEAITRFPKRESGNLAKLLGDEEARTTRALRLTGVGGSMQYLTYEDEGFSPFPFRFGLPATLKALGGSTDLTATGLQKIKQRWTTAYELSSKLLKSPETVASHVRISAVRFTNSFDKGLSEDKLIDYFIAFEALFTREDDAVSYRLPLRASIFSGDDAAERERIFRLLTVGYKLRSALAHGQDQLTQPIKVGGKKISPREFIDDIHQILFNAVHRFVRCSKVSRKDEVIRAIEGTIVSQDRGTLEKLWAE